MWQIKILNVSVVQYIYLVRDYHGLGFFVSDNISVYYHFAIFVSVTRHSLECEEDTKGSSYPVVRKCSCRN